MFEGALSGIKVLDLGHGISGPFCAKMLADFGADTVKIEPPSGDSARNLGPFFHDEPHPEKSLLFLFLNLNKKGTTLNLETTTGQSMLKKLVRTTDVVVENFRPGYLDSMGLGYDHLSAINPEIIMTSITPFGQQGPYSDFVGEELIEYAMSGIMTISGKRDKEPLKHGGSQAQFGGGLNGAAATALALMTKALTGEGQHLDISISECVTSELVVNQPMYSFIGAVQTRRPPTGDMFQNVMPCKDGYVIIQQGAGVTWDKIADFFEEPRLAQDRFTTPEGRRENAEEMDQLMVEALKDREKWELFHKAADMHILFGVVQDAKDLSNCPQLDSRGYWIDANHPIMGHIRCPGEPFKFSETPYQFHSSAPLLGEHNNDIYSEQLGLSTNEISKLREIGVL